MNNLGLLLKAMGKPEEALPLLRRALEGREATLGSTHPRTRVARSHLDALRRAMGQ